MQERSADAPDSSVGDRQELQAYSLHNPLSAVGQEQLVIGMLSAGSA